jgi:hypothetical protein
VEKTEALLLFAEVDPLLLAVGALEPVVEELELYFLGLTFQLVFGCLKT